MRKLFFATPESSPLAPGWPPEKPPTSRPQSMEAIMSERAASPGSMMGVAPSLAVTGRPDLPAAYKSRQWLRRTPFSMRVTSRLKKPSEVKGSRSARRSSSTARRSVTLSEATDLPILSRQRLVPAMMTLPLMATSTSMAAACWARAGVMMMGPTNLSGVAAVVRLSWASRRAWATLPRAMMGVSRSWKATAASWMPVVRAPSLPANSNTTWYTPSKFSKAVPLWLA